ncbi:unnamed protein product [Rotaria sordida]|uniref:CBS domain-containing protein n=1 Tax=Rotaria sordida TaxID=392033 RepID=A0A814V1D1_9BILA|nr:unnamed protein product [Rotaria sordida]
MTNLIDVFMLEVDRVVDDELVLTVHGYGYSRIPVYEKQRDNIIGLVNIRDFALLDTESGKFTVRSLSPESNVEDIVRSKDLKFRPFIPDFSLRVCENVQILRIRRTHWLAAIRATFFENKKKASGSPPILNLDGDQIDMLTQELEKANCVDRPETRIRTSSETSGEIRSRAMTLMPTTDSGRVKTGRERFFSLFRSRSSLYNVDKASSESPTTSNRNTSSLTSK